MDRHTNKSTTTKWPSDYEKLSCHAMMFNLSYINETKNCCQSFWNSARACKKRFVKFKVGDSDTYFTRVLKNKKEKVWKAFKKLYERWGIRADESFYRLMTKNILKSDYIYILNSKMKEMIWIITSILTIELKRHQ